MGFKVGDRVKFKKGCCPQEYCKYDVHTISFVGDSHYGIDGAEGPEWYKYRFEKVYPNPPHKHAEVIKAWADGAVVQVKRQGSVYWEDYLCDYPCWFKDLEYRIKPNNPNAGKIRELEAKVVELQKEIEELKDED